MAEVVGRRWGGAGPPARIILRKKIHCLERDLCVGIFRVRAFLYYTPAAVTSVGGWRRRRDSVLALEQWLLVHQLGL